jgi:hypothetical protein
MITEQQAQNCIAFLEGARAAIDSAEIHVAGATTNTRPGLQLTKAASEIAFAAHNLTCCAEKIGIIAREMMEQQNDAAAPVRPNAR